MKPIRIPRPPGLTQRMKALNLMEDSPQKNKELKRIKEDIINQYIRQGFRMNGELWDLHELGRYIGEDQRWVIRRIQKFTDQMEGKDQQGLSRLTRAFVFQNAMASRGLIMAQAAYLLESQGVSHRATGAPGKNGYVPFLTSEVNRALGNLVQSDNTMVSLLKALTPQQKASPTVTINNQQGLVANTAGNTEQLLNTNQAVKLISESREGTLLSDPDQQNRLLNVHMNDPEIPEIVATKQRGFDAKRDGALPTLKRKVQIHEVRSEEGGEIISE